MMSHSSIFTGIAVVVLLVLSPMNSTAQLIDNANGKVFTNRPFFNEKVIREKGIKSISGMEIHYKLGDKPRATDYFRSYNFNEKGQLIQQLESDALTKKADTLVTVYDYDNHGNLTAVRKKDEYGLYFYIYEYDEHGRVVKEELRQKLTRNNNISIRDKLGSQYSVLSEKSTYLNYEGQQKRTLYNSDDLPYKDIFTYYNKQGLVVEEVEKLQRVSGAKTTKFFYNKKQELDSITVNSNITGFQNRSFVYGYDKQGNLEKKEEYKNGNYVTQYQVLYDEETMLIDDVLVQDISTHFIKVLELRNYSFFGTYN